jgi:hypothetical protein
MVRILQIIRAETILLSAITGWQARSWQALPKYKAIS